MEPVISLTFLQFLDKMIAHVYPVMFIIIVLYYVGFIPTHLIKKSQARFLEGVAERVIK